MRSRTLPSPTLPTRARPPPAPRATAPRAPPSRPHPPRTTEIAMHRSPAEPKPALIAESATRSRSASG
ncbi:hypothetical protein C5D34_02890, partial [Rathayibacter sp. AY1B1]